MMFVQKYLRRLLLSAIALAATAAFAQTAPTPNTAAKVPYLKLSTPRRVLPDAQSWEGDEFPHTMSVLEFKHGGFRYWGWYGLNNGRGVGLARSNDLVNWTKYKENPLWSNARWPSVLAKADPLPAPAPPPEIKELAEHFLVLVTCRDEKEQIDLLGRLKEEGRECKALLA